MWKQVSIRIITFADPKGRARNRGEYRFRENSRATIKEQALVGLKGRQGGPDCAQGHTGKSFKHPNETPLLATASKENEQRTPDNEQLNPQNENLTIL